MLHGTLGIYPHQKVHIKLMPDAKPVHLHPLPVPCVHLQTFKWELNHLVEIRVLLPTKESECALPTFIIQKRMVAYDGSAIYIN
jgi:hypothetical protein